MEKSIVSRQYLKAQKRKVGHRTIWYDHENRNDLVCLRADSSIQDPRSATSKIIRGRVRKNALAGFGGVTWDSIPGAVGTGTGRRSVASGRCKKKNNTPPQKTLTLIPPKILRTSPRTHSPGGHSTVNYKPPPCGNTCDPRRCITGKGAHYWETAEMEYPTEHTNRRSDRLENGRKRGPKHGEAMGMESTGSVDKYQILSKYVYIVYIVYKICIV